MSTQDVASPQEEVRAQVSVTVGDASPTSAGSAPEGATTQPAAQGAGDAAAKQQIDETPVAASGPPAATAAAVAPATSSADHPAGQVSAPGTAPPVPPDASTNAGALAEVSSAQAGPQPGDSLEQLLSEVGRELRNAQGQIDDLRRGLDHGAAPPTSRLTRLRTTLVRIAPMLAALEVRLDAAGRLSPHLRQLLHRVRSDLHGVRVTAAGLVAALRHSGARSAELRLLLQELEAFRALASTLASNPAVRPVSAPAVPGASRASTEVSPAPAASPLHAEAPPVEQRAGNRRPRSSDGPRPAAPLPWASAPGSATASPGGSFFFAAVATLTMLLIGLALPALLARLDLPPGRRYSVAFLAPLERPG